MAMTARDLVNSRMQQEQQQLQAAFNRQWNMVNRRFGPPTRNPSVEAARQRALSSLHQKFVNRANSMLGKYDEQFQSFNEIDQMVEQGLITGVNPEELKMRSVLPQDVEQAVFPGEEEVEEAPDPISEYGRFSTMRSRVQRELEDFEVAGPRPPGTHSVDRRMPDFLLRKSAESYDDPGGVGNRVFKRQIIGYDKQDNPVYERVPAKGDELRRWAELTEQEREITEAMRGIEQSDAMASRIRMAATGSRRMLNGGTFASKATGAPAKQKREVKQLTPELALQIYNEAGGDPRRAEELARQRGYRF